MKTVEEIKKNIELARIRAKMYYNQGDFKQFEQWLDLADTLKWVLGDNEDNDTNSV